jgi:hypothetical protein
MEQYLSTNKSTQNQIDVLATVKKSKRIEKQMFWQIQCKCVWYTIVFKWIYANR